MSMSARHVRLRSCLTVSSNPSATSGVVFVRKRKSRNASRLHARTNKSGSFVRCMVNAGMTLFGIGSSGSGLLGLRVDDRNIQVPVSFANENGCAMAHHGVRVLKQDQKFRYGLVRVIVRGLSGGSLKGSQNE